MGRLERRLNKDTVAQVLKLGIEPHRHASWREPYPVALPPAPRQALSDKWPTPAYRARRRLKAERAALRARMVRPAPTPSQRSGPNLAQRLFESFYIAAAFAKAVQAKAREARLRERAEMQFRRRVQRSKKQ